MLHAGFYPSKLKISTQRVKAALWWRQTLSLDDLWKSMEWNIINSAIMNKAFVFRLHCNNYILCHLSFLCLHKTNWNWMVVKMLIFCEHISLVCVCLCNLMLHTSCGDSSFLLVLLQWAVFWFTPGKKNNNKKKTYKVK